LPRADAVVAIGQRARLGPASGGEAGAALVGITASGLDLRSFPRSTDF